MFIISDEIIKRRAQYSDSFRKGREYYKNNKVLKIEFNGEQNAFYGTVQGSRIYEAKVAFNQQGNITFANCTCPAHTIFGGDCKHLVAFLLSLKNNVCHNDSQLDRLGKIRNNARIGKFFEFFDTLDDKNTNEQTEVELEIFIQGDYDIYNKKFEFIMNLKIGIGGKFYIFRNFRDFFEATDAGHSYTFGKNLTFDKAIHFFNERNSKLMAFLKECYEIDERISYYGSNAKSIMSGKNIFLTDSHFKRIMNMFKDGDLSICLGGKEIKNKDIIRDKLPLEFNLFVKDDFYSLNMQNIEFKYMTKDGEYVYCNGSIYQIPQEFKEGLGLITKITHDGNALDFEKRHGERLVSEVLPQIKKIAHVHIEESLSETFIEEPLIVEVYFDKYKEGISADIVFSYSNEKIYPLRKNRQVLSEQLIVRDAKNEAEVLKLFEEPDFNVIEEKAVLTDDQRLYEFIYNKFSDLHKIAQIYYSEDFKRMINQVKVTYSTSIRITQEDLLEFTFEVDGIDKNEIREVLDSLHHKKKYHRLKNGSFLSLDDKGLNDIAEMMKELDIGKNDFVDNVAVLPKYRAFYINEKIKGEGLSIKRNLEFKHMIQNIMEPEDLDYSLPIGYEGILRPYQKRGYEWLRALDNYKLGGILADDMGLGKTLQMIVFLKSRYEKVQKPSLIIVPTSLIYNWQDEIHKFAPNMKVSIIIGKKTERDENLKNISDSTIVLTSYPLIRKDIDAYKLIDFAYCILDEAQNIKNLNSLTSRAVKKIKAGGYFALTGTPIENNLSELWSIFDFIMPGFLLSHKKFVEKYEKPIVNNQDKKAMQSLIQQISPFIIRRLKKDVLMELPDKTESKMLCPMTKEQKKIYLAYLAKAKKDIMNEIDDKGFERSQIKILSILTRLRQICCHPGMFIENYKGESGKLEILMELVKECLTSNHRILLFSQYTSMLAIIKKEFEKENIPYSYLDGSTKILDRKKVVTEFNEGKDSVLLISLKAGGTGLNLTGADTVIHFDPWWNPAVEDQATDRAYRIGQENKVQVYKLITYGTIEEKIYNLQMKKKNMIDAVIKPGETMIDKMSMEDIKELLTLK